MLSGTGYPVYSTGISEIARFDTAIGANRVPNYSLSGPASPIAERYVKDVHRAWEERTAQKTNLAVKTSTDSRTSATGYCPILAELLA